MEHAEPSETKARATSELQPGDVIGHAVYDDNGNCLVHEGAKVTPGLTRVLTRRGVATVMIRDPDVAPRPEPVHRVPTGKLSDPEIRRRIGLMEERLNLGFHRHTGNVTMAVLYKAAVEYLTAKIVKRYS